MARGVFRAEFASIAPLDVLERAHRADALAWDVSLWYVIDADRHSPLMFDPAEFKAVQWFHASDAPIARSDPRLTRFLRKLAQTSRPNRARLRR